jgi:hypothetical protein
VRELHHEWENGEGCAGQSFRQRTGGVLPGDGHHFAGEDGSGIHTLVHQHDADAGGLMAGEDRRRYRRGAPTAR